MRSFSITLKFYLAKAYKYLLYLPEKRDGQDIICSLVLDEMAVRKHVDWDGEKFRGYVDIGTEVVDDASPES